MKSVPFFEVLQNVVCEICLISKYSLNSGEN